MKTTKSYSQNVNFMRIFSISHSVFKVKMQVVSLYGEWEEMSCFLPVDQQTNENQRSHDSDFLYKG